MAEIEVVARNPSSSMSSSTDIEAVSSEEQEPLLDTKKKQEDWESGQLKPRHTIFLSHSGAQKNFVEQLCVDLEGAKQVPFFDKRPDSLPKGEKFAQLIFQAAQQCQLAIVVVSEEYFSRSKWPMLELAAFAQASKHTNAQLKQTHRCTILPLFLGLSCKEFGDPKRRQLWFKRWDEWAQEDPRIRVDVWKEALHELDGRNGMEFIEANGEVQYRKEVVATACGIVQRNLLLDQVLPSWMLLFLKTAFRVIGFLCLCIVMGSIFFGIFVPHFSKFAEEMNNQNRPPLPKPTCTIGVNGKPGPCPDYLLDFVNYTGPR